MPGPNFRVKNKGGAPKGNRNALKDGLYTGRMLRARRAMHCEVRAMILRVRATVAQACLITPAQGPVVTVVRKDVTPSPPRPNS
jgi:hypothetical protein